MIEVVRTVGPILTVLFSMHALIARDLSSAFMCLALGVLMLNLYRTDLNTCREEIEERRKDLFGYRPLRGLERYAFILFLATYEGRTKWVLMLFFTGFGGIAVGAAVLVEAL